MTQTFLTQADDFEDALADLIWEFKQRGTADSQIKAAMLDKVRGIDHDAAMVVAVENGLI